MNGFYKDYRKSLKCITEDYERLNDQIWGQMEKKSIPTEPKQEPMVTSKRMWGKKIAEEVDRPGDRYLEGQEGV